MSRNRLVVAVALTLHAGGAFAADPAPARPSGLSEAEKLEKATDSLARMKNSLKAVLGRVEQARNEKDVVKLNCVNDKLTQIKGLLRVAEQADVALHEAAANKDPGTEAEYSKIAIARTKIDVLKGEADQCIGQLAYVVDERTTVEVQQPDSLPDPLEGNRGRGRRGFGKTPLLRAPAVMPPTGGKRY